MQSPTPRNHRPLEVGPKPRRLYNLKNFPFGYNAKIYDGGPPEIKGAGHAPPKKELKVYPLGYTATIYGPPVQIWSARRASPPRSTLTRLGPSSERTPRRLFVHPPSLTTMENVKDQAHIKEVHKRIQRLSKADDELTDTSDQGSTASSYKTALTGDSPGINNATKLYHDTHSGTNTPRYSKHCEANLSTTGSANNIAQDDNGTMEVPRSTSVTQTPSQSGRTQDLAGKTWIVTPEGLRRQPSKTSSSISNPLGGDHALQHRSLTLIEDDRLDTFVGFTRAPSKRDRDDSSEDPPPRRPRLQLNTHQDSSNTAPMFLPLDHLEASQLHEEQQDLDLTHAMGSVDVSEPRRFN
jgi:hypothetical protein